MPESERFFIDGPVGQLEAQLDIVENARRIAVVLHPHPLHEGSNMQQKIPVMLARGLVEAGTTVLRFNFRGVGQSAGEHDDGIGEQQDALAAVEYLRKRYPDLPLWIAGFSFGAATAIRIAAAAKAEQIITVAPPASYFADGTPEVPCPWLVIYGEEDEIASWPEADRWLSDLGKDDLTVEHWPGVGHFFHGKTVVIKRLVTELATAEN